MLHLAVIGLVCAVSAPSEGPAFIERKNNESNIFCHFDGGGPNIAKVSLPNAYDVAFRNSSDPGEEKFPNRSSSFFYEYFIKQYQDNKNSSCSIMESVSSGKKKKFRSQIGFLKRKKRSSHDFFDTTKPKKGLKVTPKTLRPPLQNDDKKETNDLLGSLNRKPKIKATQELRAKCKSDLNCGEKKMFFRLKNLRKRPCCDAGGKCRKTGRACKRHLDRLKVDDELDLNKRIEKLVKQIALENQRKENSATALALVEDIPKGKFESLSLVEKPSKKVSSFPFFNHIKKIFSFSKNYFHNKVAGNVVNSVPVNSERGKDLVSDKAAHISSYDVLKTMHKTTRLRRNLYKSHTPSRQNYNPVPVCKNELDEKSHPHSTNFKGKINALHPRFRRKCTPENLRRKKHRIKKRGMKRRKRKVQNFQKLNKINFQNDGSRLRREDDPTSKENPNGQDKCREGVAAKDSKASLNEHSQAPFTLSREPITEEILVKGSKASPQFTRVEETTANRENEAYKNTDQFPIHTLERPFLERYFRKEKFRKENPSLGYESITEIPSSNYKYEPPIDELTPSRYLKIRHALRNYLIHNNVFTPSKRSYRSLRKKRCEAKPCARPHKCWRSAPLLCLPYIKKCQEDQLKYIIKVLQSMIGKPFPPRVDIFERTKFKPTLRPDNDNDGGNPSDDCCVEYSPTPPCSTTSRPSNWFPSVSPATCSPPCSLTCSPPCPPTCPPSSPPTCPPSSPPTCPPPSPPTCPPTFPPTFPPTCPPTCPPSYPPTCSPPYSQLPALICSSTPSPIYSSTPCPTCYSPSPSPPPCPPVCPETCPSVYAQTCTTPTYFHMSSTTWVPNAAVIYSTSSYPCAYSATPSYHVSPSTTGCISSQELPISFPVLGQGADPTTSCCNYDDFVTTPYNYAADSVSHVPIIPTMPLSPPPPTCVSSWAPSGKAPIYSRSSLMNSSPAYVPFYTTASPRYTVGSPTTPFRCFLTPSGNTCGYHNSESPIERKEYFSFTAFSYNDPSDIATESYQYAESLTSRYPHSNTIQSPGSRCNQKIYPQRALSDGCFITPVQNPSTNGQQTQHPTPTPHAVVSSATHNSKIQVKGQSKSFRERKQSYPEYFFETTFTSTDQSNRKFNANKKYNRAQLQELVPYEDEFIPPTEHNSQMKYEISQNRLFRMHHNGNPKPHYRPMDTYPDYDYDFYDKYPEENRRQNEAKFGKPPPLQSPWKDYEWKPKVEKRGTSKKRRKREDDYYASPEKFESYNDYFDDPSYSEEFLKKHPETDAKINDDYSWTPPSFDMFNELAKAVTSTTETNATLDSNQSSETALTTEGVENRTISERNQAFETSTNGSNNVQNDKDKSKMLSNTTNHVTDKGATTTTISKSVESSRQDFGIDVGATTIASGNRTLENSKNKRLYKTKFHQSAVDSKSEDRKTTKFNATERTVSETVSEMHYTKSNATEKTVSGALSKSNTTGKAVSETLSEIRYPKSNATEKTVSGALSKFNTTGKAVSETLSEIRYPKSNATEKTVSGALSKSNTTGKAVSEMLSEIRYPKSSATEKTVSGTLSKSNTTGKAVSETLSEIRYPKSNATEKTVSGTLSKSNTTGKAVSETLSEIRYPKSNATEKTVSGTLSKSNTTGKAVSETLSEIRYPKSNATGKAVSGTLSKSNTTGKAVSETLSEIRYPKSNATGKAVSETLSQMRYTKPNATERTVAGTLSETHYTKSNTTEKTVSGTPSEIRYTTVNSKVAFREDKRSGRKQKQNVNPTEEGQEPTTLRMASIAKGPKKCVLKPSPKIYSKVFPDSLNNEADSSINATRTATSNATRTATSNATRTATGNATSNATGTTTSSATTNGTTTATTTKNSANSTAIRTPAATLASTTQIDLKLQLLAVCEGYLEVIKLIKAQNQTPSEELDMNLAQYCENIISQSFNCASDKPKKSDISDSAPQLNDLSSSVQFDENLQKFDNVYESGNDSPEDVDDSNAEKVVTESVKKKKLRKRKGRKNLNYGEATSTEIAEGRLEKREKKRSSASTTGKKKRQEKAEDSEESMKKGVTQEQIEVIKLLTKRKKALLSWLQSTKDETKPDDTKETEYFEDEDLIEPSPDFSMDSGTIKPKRDERTTERTQNIATFLNESIFPVYAKQYGYNSGGEVREVEVLWRKVNEKTHEKKVFKNVSVLALLLTSTNGPDVNHGDTKLVGSNGYESEENSEIQSKSDSKVGFAADVANSQTTSTTLSETSVYSNTEHKSTGKSEKSDCKDECTTEKSDKKNATHTIITKPDVSTIVGKPSGNANKTHCNTTRKVCHRFEAAKDLFQECSIEFLDYAVYILPIMFTILFLFCCLCCAVHILHTRKCQKRKKRRKKIAISSDDTTEETTEESEFESKKRKREAKRKRKSKKDGDCENLYNKKVRKFWNVLNLHSGKSNGGDKNQTEKKKSFLRFLKCKTNEGKTESFSCIPLGEVDEIRKQSEDSVEASMNDPQYSRTRKKDDEKRKSHEDNEAADRREIIALLEELKKIETEHTGERKEVKSVQVQYMTQEDENSVFQRPDFSYPYDKNVFGLPKGYSFCSNQNLFHQTEPAASGDYEFYDSVNELTELLPCECDYYSKRNNYCDFRMNQGRCEGFLKILRNSGVSHSKPFIGTNCRKNESKNRTFIFNKYRSINTDENEELMGVTLKDTGTEVRFMENSSPFTLHPQNNADLVEEMENFKRQLNKKKNVRLKDDGVLCRL